MDRLMDGLRRRHGPRGDVEVLADIFGPTRFLHLRRLDEVAQAVSWARAEQSGVWQQDDESANEPSFDPALIHDLVRRIRDHNTAWQTWFAAQGIAPLELTYEQVIAVPGDTVAHVLRFIEADLPDDWVPVSHHGRQADAVNAEWIARVRRDFMA